MDPGTADRGLSEAGVTSVQFLLASVLALVVFVALANLVVVQYTRGALRSALDQGVRVGAVHQSPSMCEARVATVLADLLAGEIGDSVVFECSSVGGLMAAEASVAVESWVSWAGDYHLNLVAEAVIEPNGT